MIFFAEEEERHRMKGGQDEEGGDGGRRGKRQGRQLKGHPTSNIVDRAGLMLSVTG